MRRHRAWIASAIAVIGLSAACGHVRAAQPCSNKQLGHVLVKNADAATRIAFAEWYAANPQFRGHDEKTWATYFTVTLRDCVWQIAEKPIPPRTYSTFVLQVGASDGRFLGALVSD